MARIPAVTAELKLAVEADKFNRQLIKYLSVLDGDLGRAVVKVARRVEAGAKRRCPVDTGRARASIHTVTYGQTSDLGRAPQTPLQAVVGSNVNYIVYLEAGSSKQAPAGMFRVTLEELRGALKDAVRGALKSRAKLSG